MPGRRWPSRLAWASCDTLLILAGAGGVSGLLVGFPALRGALLLGGATFLAYLGVRSWRTAAGAVRLQPGEASGAGRVLWRYRRGVPAQPARLPGHRGRDRSRRRGPAGDCLANGVTQTRGASL